VSLLTEGAVEVSCTASIGRREKLLPTPRASVRSSAFLFNPTYLIDGVTAVDSEKVRFKLNESLEACVVPYMEDGSGWTSCTDHADARSFPELALAAPPPASHSDRLSRPPTRRHRRGGEGPIQYGEVLVNGEVEARRAASWLPDGSRQGQASEVEASSHVRRLVNRTIGRRPTLAGLNIVVGTTPRGRRTFWKRDLLRDDRFFLRVP